MKNDTTTSEQPPVEEKAEGHSYSATNGSSLADELPGEIKRCQELVHEYKMIGPAGMIGATLIQLDIDWGINALASGDVIEMLKAYESLKNCE